jgi:hypothetical protein
VETKLYPWDESVRVPFLLRWPGLPGSAGRNLALPLDAPDIMPTLLGLCSLPVPETVEGRDWSPFFRGEAQPTGEEAALLTMPAEFIYHTVPKKDQTAYLIAKIPQWEQYNLLPGQASIFFEETYVGNTTINPKVVSDTLLLSMGRDELISIERKSVKEVSSTKWLGTSKREVKVFEINIKNNKKTDARIEVLDQIPVSRQNDIVVELESQDGAEYTPENGRLKWLFTLKAGESKKIRFSYSLKYPGNQQIIIRN